MNVYATQMSIHLSVEVHLRLFRNGFQDYSTMTMGIRENILHKIVEDGVRENTTNQI
jgi:hypothetical protein